MNFLMLLPMFYLIVIHLRILRIISARTLLAKSTRLGMNLTVELVILPLLTIISNLILSAIFLISILLLKKTYMISS